MFRFFALFLAVASIIEIFVIIKVGQAIGATATVLIMIVTSVIGVLLFKREGKQAFTVAQLDLQQGRMPGGAIIDALAILLGGVLLFLPGFIGNIVGLLLLLPVTRGMMKLLLVKWFSNILRSKNVIVYRNKW